MIARRAWSKTCTVDHNASRRNRDPLTRAKPEAAKQPRASGAAKRYQSLQAARADLMALRLAIRMLPTERRAKPVVRPEQRHEPLFDDKREGGVSPNRRGASRAQSDRGGRATRSVLVFSSTGMANVRHYGCLLCIYVVDDVDSRRHNAGRAQIISLQDTKFTVFMVDDFLIWLFRCPYMLFERLRYIQPSEDVAVSRQIDGQVNRKLPSRFPWLGLLSAFRAAAEAPGGERRRHLPGRPVFRWRWCRRALSLQLGRCLCCQFRRAPPPRSRGDGRSHSASRGPPSASVQHWPSQRQQRHPGEGRAAGSAPRRGAL
jgi:hypothetical protein